eukprot:4917820-Alexandrium_andersonii.AAC.1
MMYLNIVRPQFGHAARVAKQGQIIASATAIAPRGPNRLQTTLRRQRTNIYTQAFTKPMPTTSVTH